MNFNKFTYITIVILLNTISANSQSTLLTEPLDCPEGDWILLFEDNFDGNTLDRSVWSTFYDYRNDGIDNYENARVHKFPGLDNNPSNNVKKDNLVEVNNGSLFLKAKYETTQWFGETFPYQTSMLWLKQQFNNYHKYEIRCKIPGDQDIVTSFWTFGHKEEIDIFEVADRSEPQFTIHHWKGGSSDQCPTKKDVGIGDGFHIFTVEYMPDFIVWYMDGVEINRESHFDEVTCNTPASSFPRTDDRNECFFPENQSSNLIATLKTGPSFLGGGSPTGSSFPYEWEIDYIKVYSRTSCSTNETLVVNDNMDITSPASYKNIIIEDGGELNISNTVVKICPNGAITLKDGASLIINNSTITKMDDPQNSNWLGISVPDRGERASVQILNESKIEYAKYPFSNTEIVGQLKVGGRGWLPRGGDLSFIMDKSTVVNCDHGIMFLDNTDGIDVAVTNSTISSAEPDGQIYHSGIYLIKFDEGDIEVKNNSVSGFTNGILIGNSERLKTIESNALSNNNKGIRILGSNNTIIYQNTFYDNSIGVDVINSSVDIIEDNSFDSNFKAIQLKGTDPLSMFVRIGSVDNTSNKFINNYKAIYASGFTHPIVFTIENNQFEEIQSSTDDGIFIEGDNHYNIVNNTFSGLGQPVTLSYNGILFNDIHCNEFNLTANETSGEFHQDLYLRGDLSHTTFFENDFNSGNVKNNVLLDNVTIMNQGKINNPADNCFNTTLDDNIVSTASTKEFDYYYNTDLECLNPSIGSLFPNKIESANKGGRCPTVGSNNLTGGGGNNDSTIFTTITPPIVTVDPVFCYQFFDVCVKDSIDFWIKYINDNFGDNPKTFVVEDHGSNININNANYGNSKLQKWINYVTIHCINTSNLPLIESILVPLKKWVWQKQLFGIYLRFDEVTKANNLLNSFPNKSPIVDVDNFKMVQQINLNRLNSEFSYLYDASPLELDQLKYVALSDTPSSGFAKGLYYLITDEDIISLYNRNSARTDNTSNIHKASCNIYPNPATDILTIESNNLNISSISIHSILGQLEYSNEYIQKTKHQIQLNNISAGTKIIKVIFENGDVLTSKSVIVD